jgi:hypothetical protein
MGELPLPFVMVDEVKDSKSEPMPRAKDVAPRIGEIASPATGIARAAKDMAPNSTEASANSLDSDRI